MSRHPRVNDGTESTFLRRWSRRKQGVEEAAPATPEPVEPEPRSDGSHEATDEPVKTDDDMPDLETIDETTDMTDFFSPGVSDQLRNQALRRLFHLAKFNVTDGLDDYCEDFRNFQPLGDIVTADMRHRMEVEKQRLAQAAEEEAQDAIAPETARDEAGAPSPGQESEPDPDSTEAADAEAIRPEDDPESEINGKAGTET